MIQHRASHCKGAQHHSNEQPFPSRQHMSRVLDFSSAS
jgi:hypothetical protein